MFELSSHEFLRGNIPCCMTFSKCVRKGSDLILSGSDAYHGIVFPLTKAIQHLTEMKRQLMPYRDVDCEVIIGMAVIDAPLVGVRIADGDLKTSLIPWVRIVRHLPMSGESEPQVFGIEVVHKDFLMDYIGSHAIPFAERFAELAIKHHNVLADGRGFVSGMAEDRRSNLESRLVPRVR